MCLNVPQDIAQINHMPKFFVPRFEQ